MIPGNANPLLLASAAADGAAAGVATKSLRFNSGDSAFLSRTPSSAGNRKKFTFSAWVKKTTITDSQRVIFSAYGGTGNAYVSIDFRHDSPRFLGWNGSSVTFEVKASRVLRDPSAWYHIIWAVDTSQSTAANRAKLYINGVEETDFQTSSYPSQNSDLYVNTTNVHKVGENAGTDSAELDGYLADVYFIDGSQLDESSFGAFDDNGIWQAAVYSGTYGTNGFHLAFGNSSTDAALGTDSSGNNNTFAVNNLTTAPGLATANQGFNCVTYTGNGGTQSVSGVGFQPDLVWFKSRSEAQNHAMFDVVRGVQKRIHPNLTQSEDDSATGLTAFNSDGFTVGSNNVNNKNNTTYVAWCWKAGGSPSSNTDGTITSSVSVNNTYGFSIINHTGTGAAGTFGHGLSSAPDFLIFKNREATDNWFVWTRALNDTNTGGIINSTNAFFTNGVQELNQTLPTDSVIHVGNNLASNGNGQDVITYAWTEISGFSKFGKYTGNGSTDGPTVTLGFKPRFILLRSTSASRAWCIYDTQRDTSTTNDNNLFANNNSAESSDSSHNITILDDGFKLATTSVNRNGNGETYIYMAFADKPNGADNDSLFDVPTNGTQSDTGAGGEVSGNYAVLNPLNKHTSNNSFSNGNLEFTTSGSDGGLAESTIAVSSGKFYFEVVYSRSDQGQLAGIRKPGSRNYNDSYIYVGTGNKYTNGGSGASYGATLAHGDVIGTAFDADNGTLTFYKNGTSQGQAFSGISGTYSFFVGSFGGAPTGIVNFGARPFSYAAPSGFKALNTANLPTATVADGSDYHDTLLYTGNGASSRTISGYSFSPDFLWVKVRTASGGDFSPRIMDAVRGAGVSLRTNGTDAERDSSATTGGGVETFTSDGFTIEAGGGSNINANNNNSPYVAWGWDAGSSTVTNTSGSVNSSVRANPTAGFSIAAFTVSSDGNVTVGHGLGAVPELIIVKRRTGSEDWYVHHTSLASDKMLKLNSTGGVTNSDVGNSTLTNTLFNHAANSGDHIAYCFTSIYGYQALGQFTGNTTITPFIFTGFAVQWLLIKGYDDSNDHWKIYDNARSPFNVTDDFLSPNTSNAETTSNNNKVDFLSNGFKIRTTGGGDSNLSSKRYIYLAIAENPFQANGGLAR